MSGQNEVRIMEAYGDKLKKETLFDMAKERHKKKPLVLTMASS